MELLEKTLGASCFKRQDHVIPKEKTPISVSNRDFFNEER